MPLRAGRLPAQHLPEFRMKVVALTPLYLPVMGGIEILVAGLARELRSKGVEITVVTDTAGRLPSREVVDGTTVVRLGLYGAIRSGDPSRTLATLKQFEAVLEEVDADIIHLHSATQAAAFFLERYLRKRSQNVPLVVTQHGVLEPEDKIDLARSIVARAQAVTAVSKSVVDSVVDFTGRADIVKIGNGVSGSVPFPKDRGQPTRRILLCVGRLQLEKGFDTAIRALALLPENYGDVRLHIIGGGECGDRFRVLARDLGVESQVEFLGALAHTATIQIISEASTLLVPSRTREGFSLVAAEAALSGTPCIVSDVGGLPETVVDGVTGFVVPPNDVDAMCRAIRSLLDDTNMWQRMSRAARTRAQTVFDIERCARQYASLYSSLMK